MAGFLDKETRVVDMILTAEGRRLLSRGSLSFVYWMPFDDEVDYNPFLSDSGSISSMEMSASKTEQIEHTLVREAVPGYRMGNASGSDETNVHRPLFTSPQGQQVLPRMIVEPTGSQMARVRQHKLVEFRRHRGPDGRLSNDVLGPFDRGFQRMDASSVRFTGKYMADSWPDDYRFAGFLVRLLRSGSNGVTDVPQRIDTTGEPVFENQFRITVP